MTQESTGTASAQGGAGKNDLIERARKAAGEWHCVCGYAWALRFLPLGADRDGRRFEIRRVQTEPPKNEYNQYLYRPGRLDLAVSWGGAVWHSDLSANDLPNSAEDLAGAVTHSLRKRPRARGWERFANAFDWLTPDFFGPHPELSGWGAVRLRVRGKRYVFRYVGLVYTGKNSPGAWLVLVRRRGARRRIAVYDA